MHWNGGWPMMGWMWIFWIVVTVLAVFLVRWLVTSSGRDSNRSRETPEEILKKRYARGEIDREEYEHRLQDLRR